MNLGPYEPNNIYCGECAEMMSKLPDGCIDMVLTSPPYDSLREYQGYTFDYTAVISQIYRVLKPGGVCVWVVADETKNGGESLTSFEHALFARTCGFKQETMVYEQAGTGAKGSNYFYWQSFEFMFVWVKGERPRVSNRIADVKNTSGGKVRGFSPKSAHIGSRVDRPNVVAPEYSVRPNVWRYAVGSDGETENHPAPFPNKLARDHIISWSNPGDICLDPFVGSGTTPKMAMQNGRQYLGFDISPEYVELAKKRVAYANPPLLVIG